MSGSAKLAVSSIAVFLLVCTSGLIAGQGDVTVKISNDLGAKFADQVVIGETNTLEIWIANEETLLGASWGFEIAFSCDREWIMEKKEGQMFPQVREAGRAQEAFNMPGLLIQYRFHDDGIDSLVLGGAAMNAGMKKGASELAYTFQFKIPESVSAMRSGLCIKPIFYPPAGTWTQTDGDGGYAPTFNGQPTLKESNPRAKAACFDIVKGR